MNIYVINMLLLIVYTFIGVLFFSDKRNILYSNSGELSEKQVSLLPIIFFQLWAIMSLRHWTVGTDTISYKLGFEIANHTNWNQIFDLTEKNLIYNYERGFVLLTKLIRSVTANLNIYLSLTSLIMLYPVYRVIKKYSPMPLLSVFLYITLNFFHFSMSGMRQGIAFSIVFFSYNYLVRNQKIKFVACLLAASTIHTSALFFIVIIFFKDFRFTINKMLIYLFSIIPIFIFRKRLFSIVSLLYYSVEKETYNTGAYTLFIVVLFTFVGALLFYKRTTKKFSNALTLYNIVAVAPILMLFNSISQSALRVANYFYIFIILLIPTVLKALNSRERFLITVVLIILCSTFYLFFGMKFLGTGEYRFFWQ